MFDDCYIIWGEDGYKECLHSHKMGEDCILFNNIK